ncbi:MAG: hypothetical protein H6601_04010 [Flavobacteriales bacterium]|nr:hypothetical protein [Flavobacteriales bacterium]MCB9185890.1 hypothetical protein [Flavobacteriales bacterium]
MRNIFSLLVLLLMTIQSQAVVLNDPTSEPAIEIASTIENNYLKIDVGNNLAGSVMTLSVFNSLGEVVLENTLGLGLNKISVAGFAKGEYVAVVRENGVYTSKSSFEVK